MKVLATLAVAAFLPTVLVAQAVVDARALEDCSTQFSAFTKIRDCLPASDVGVTMLDTIAAPTSFGDAGQALAEECLALNDGKYVGAWSCASNAIDDAIALGEMLPEGAAIPDARFAPLNRPELKDGLDSALKEARAKFPDVSVWGLNMYRALK